MAICLVCRHNEAMPGELWCSAECMADYNAGRRWQTCMDCGREFLTHKKQKSCHLCDRCKYARYWRAAPRPKKARGVDHVAEVIREQAEISEKTGKKLSYGEIMASRGGKNK